MAIGAEWVSAVAGPMAAVRHVAGPREAPATQPGMTWQSPGGIRSLQGGGADAPSSMHDIVAGTAIGSFTISRESADGVTMFTMFMEASMCASHALPNPVSGNGMNAA